MLILSIRNDAVVISDGGRDRIIRDVVDFNEYLNVKARLLGVPVADVPVAKSSTIDFPDEFTDNPDTIALAIALRT